MNDEIPAWTRRCPSGKIKFATASDARKTAQQYRHKRSHKALKGSMRPYRCPECSSFHLSSTGRTNR